MFFFNWSVLQVIYFPISRSNRFRSRQFALGYSTTSRYKTDLESDNWTHLRDFLHLPEKDFGLCPSETFNNSRLQRKITGRFYIRMLNSFDRTVLIWLYYLFPVSFLSDLILHDFKVVNRAMISSVKLEFDGDPIVLEGPHSVVQFVWVCQIRFESPVACWP